MKIKAFTLTEVLLTLAIIGVITSVTIPTLMAQNHAKKYQTMTKKAIYTLQTAVDAKFEQSTSKMDKNTPFFKWLSDEGADPDEHPEDAIRLTKYDKNNATAKSDVAQTADGIMYIATVTGASSKYKHGAKVRFLVDLNGTEPPTQTTVESGTIDDTTAEDLIYLEMDKYGTIKPIGYNGNSNAFSYFDLGNNGL